MEEPAIAANLEGVAGPLVRETIPKALVSRAQDIAFRVQCPPGAGRRATIRRFARVARAEQLDRAEGIAAQRIESRFSRSSARPRPLPGPVTRRVRRVRSPLGAYRGSSPSIRSFEMTSRLLSAGRLRTGSRRSTLSGAVDIEIGDGTVRRLGRATS